MAQKNGQLAGAPVTYFDKHREYEFCSLLFVARFFFLFSSPARMSYTVRLLLLLLLFAPSDISMCM